MQKFLPLLLVASTGAFAPTPIRIRPETAVHSAVSEVSVEPKEAVKLFGRLAEKYIMLDESGGMCCYSACKDCEYRLPDGGYRMADQSASRPKWIPTYGELSFGGQNKQHTAKWLTDLFGEETSLSKEEFVAKLVEMSFSPPLGGPFVAASAAQIEDTTAAELLFDLLAGEKEKLARFRMSTSLKEMSEGEPGLTWPAFSRAFGL